jgi:hypothetical protein
VNESLTLLMTWCGAVPLGGGVILGLLLAGAAGSPMHCVPMCGGFVLSQVADRLATMPAARMCEWRRIGAAALLPYHLGRLTTYAAIGALIGLGGAALSRLPWLGWVSGILLLLGAGLFLMQAVRRLAPALGCHLPVLDRPAAAWGRTLRRATVRLSRDRPLSGYAIGLVLGFLPCGFLYAALAIAAASASPLIGAAGLVAFGIGTVPALVVVGIAGQAAGYRYHRGAAALAPVLMLINTVLLTGLALRSLT